MKCFGKDCPNDSVDMILIEGLNNDKPISVCQEHFDKIMADALTVDPNVKLERRTEP